MAKEKKEKKKEDLSGLAIPACIMIGIGIGFLTENVPAWTMIGLGAGFLGMILLKIVLK